MSGKTYMRSHVAKLVRESRLRRGASQSELSRALGFLNGQYISNVERGICGVPPKYMQAICDLLGIEVDKFVAAAVADFEDSLRLQIVDGVKPVEGVTFRVPFKLANGRL